MRHAGAFACLLALPFALCRGSYAQGIQYEIQKLTPRGADTCATAQIIPVNVPKPGEPPLTITLPGDNSLATFGDSPNACCLPESRCVTNGSNVGGLCDSDADCTSGTCETCAVLSEPDCDALDGYWLGPGNIPIDMSSVVSCKTGEFQACGEGSCCTAPGECRDEISAGIPMTASFCKTLTGNPPNYVGGPMCDYPKDPCPECEIDAGDNCQLPDETLRLVLMSDLTVKPHGAVHADDFIPSSAEIDRICVWGSYLDPELPHSYFDCPEAVEDNFRVRVYEDDDGLPGQLIAERAEITGDAVSKVEIPLWQWWWEHPRMFVSTLSFPTIKLPSAGQVYWLEVANKTDVLADGTEDPENTCHWHWAQVLFSGNGNYHNATGTDDRPGEPPGSGYTDMSHRWSGTAFCLSGPDGPVSIQLPKPPTGACCDCDGVCENGLTQGECARFLPTSDRRWTANASCADAGVCDPPPLDNCSGAGSPGAGGEPTPAIATTITDGFYGFDTTCATTDGPPEPVGEGDFLGKDIWFCYTASCTGWLTASMCASSIGNGGGYDAYMAVYHDFNNPDQCVCPDLLPPYLIAVADDNCNGIPDWGAGVVDDQLVFPGEEWLIRVGGWGMSEASTASGRGFLDVACEPAVCFPPSTPSSPTVLDDVTLVPGQNTATTGPSIKNRYISVQGGDPRHDQAIRVRVVSLPAPYDVWDGMDFWVDSIREVCENGGSTGGPPCPPEPNLPKDTFWAATLSCDWNDALFMDWTTLDLPVHIYNEVIVPSNRAQGKNEDAVYEVAFVDDDCPLKGDAGYSAVPLVVIQPRWGDTIEDWRKDPCGAPQGITNISDVTGILAKFQNLAGAPIKSRADIVGIPPNEATVDRNVSILDVTWDLSAFIGGKYGFPPGDPCR